MTGNMQNNPAEETALATKIEAKLTTEESLSEARREMIDEQFMEHLKSSTDEKDHALYETLIGSFSLESDKNGKLVLVEKANSVWQDQLNAYFSELEQAVTRQPIDEFLTRFNLPNEDVDYSFDKDTNEVVAVQLKTGGNTIRIKKNAPNSEGDETWTLTNFGIDFGEDSAFGIGVGEPIPARRCALDAAYLVYKVVKMYDEGTLPIPKDPEAPFKVLGYKLYLHGNAEGYNPITLEPIDSDARVPFQSRDAFLKSMNELYGKLLLNRQITAPAPSDVPAAPGATPATTGGSGAEKPAEAAPETVSEVNPEYVANVREKMAAILALGASAPMTTLNRTFETALNGTDVDAIQAAGDAILARWKELNLNATDAEIGVTVAALSTTSAQAAEAGAESGTGIDSHEAFREALKNNPRDYFLELPRVNPDGTSEKVVSLHLQNAESVKYSLVQDFLGKDGEAAIGLSEDKLKKTTVTLIEPGEVSRAGHVGQTVGTPYTWNGETWVDKDGDRLKVYWNTKFSYKTQEQKPAAATEPAPQ